MPIYLNNSANYPISFFSHNIFNGLTSTQKKVIALAALIIGVLGTIYAAYRFSKTEMFARTTRSAKDAEVYRESNAEPDCIDPILNPPFANLGLHDFNAVFHYLQQLGRGVEYLNLKDFHHLDDRQFGQLVNCCPNIKHLYLESEHLGNGALAHLRGMQLESIHFFRCHNLTGDAFVHLQGMPLKKVWCIACINIDDTAFTYLRTLPLLEDINFSSCYELTDAALQHLTGMQVKRAVFMACHRLTDLGVSYLVSLPQLERINFKACHMLTHRANTYVSQMPQLKSCELRK